MKYQSSLFCIVFLTSLLCALQAATAANVFSVPVPVWEPYYERREIFYIYLEGVIEKGDLEKIEKEASGKLILELILRSPGGDVEESLKIADYVNSRLILVRAPDRSFLDDRKGACHYSHKLLPPDDERNCTCDSACSLVWLLAPARDGAFVGVHRPRFEYQQYSKLPLPDAKKAYEQMLRQLKEILITEGVDGEIINAMINTSSNTVSVLDITKVLAIGTYKPFLDELLNAKCSQFAEDQHRYTAYDGEYKLQTKEFIQACINRKSDSCPSRVRKLDQLKKNAPKRPSPFESCREESLVKLRIDAQTD